MRCWNVPSITFCLENEKMVKSPDPSPFPPPPRPGVLASVQLYLRVRDDGFCTFPDGRLQPPEQALAEGLCLVPGVNSVRFEIRCDR